MTRGNLSKYILAILLTMCGLLFVYNVTFRDRQVIFMEETTKGNSFAKYDEHQTPLSKDIDCRGKKSRVPTVFSRDLKNWRENKEICARCFQFPNTTLKTPFGNTPIYIYEGKNDVWVSTEIQSRGTFESSKSALIFKMLKDDPELNLIDIGANIGMTCLIERWV